MPTATTTTTTTTVSTSTTKTAAAMLPPQSPPATLDYATRRALVETDVQWSDISVLRKRARCDTIVVPCTNFFLYESCERIRATSEDAFFRRLASFDKHRSIAIDGMSGIGKTTIIMQSNRRYEKINVWRPEISESARYNYDVLRAIEYITFPECVQFLDDDDAADAGGGVGVLWDRSNMANLIFYFVHQLMAHYGDRRMPLDPTEPWGVLTNRAIRTNLEAIVNAVPIQPTIFLVSSDIDLVAVNLTRRGDPSDLVMVNKRNYHVAQYHAYSFFAELLQQPIMDMAQVTSTMQTFQDRILENVNYLPSRQRRAPVSSAADKQQRLIDDHDAPVVTIKDCVEAHHKPLMRLSDSMFDDALIYLCSGK